MLMRIYNDSKTFVVDAELEKTVRDIRDILAMKSPFGNIYKLPGLNDQFRNRYSSILEEMSGPVHESIKDNRKRVLEELDQQTTYKAECDARFRQKALDRFEELTTKADSCNNVASLKNIPVEADALKLRFLNDSAAYIVELTPPPSEDEEEKPTDYVEVSEQTEGNEGKTKFSSPPMKLKSKKIYSLKNISPSTSWQLESESDVEEYVDALKKKLNSLLEEDTIVQIEL